MEIGIIGLGCLDGCVFAFFFETEEVEGLLPTVPTESNDLELPGAEFGLEFGGMREGDECHWSDCPRSGAEEPDVVGLLLCPTLAVSGSVANNTTVAGDLEGDEGR